MPEYGAAHESVPVQEPVPPPLYAPEQELAPVHVPVPDPEPRPVHAPSPVHEPVPVQDTSVPKHRHPNSTRDNIVLP
ncbi:unnamed protein product, partial [Brenthis ino]